MSHLPILVPGHNPADTRTVLVPCRLPESVTFLAFLPSRGVREFTLWLTSTDPLKAEIADVQPTNKEGDPRGPDGWTLDEDESRHADDAAADVLGSIFAGLHLNQATRTPYNRGSAILHTVATAYDAEVKAFTALMDAWRPLPARIAGHDLCPAHPSEGGSLAARMLEAYVSCVAEEAAKAQADKAEKQAAEWSPVRHHEDVDAEPYEVTP